MAKDYFQNAKDIVNTLLENMSNHNELDDSQYYTIDVLNVEDTTARVMVCNEYRYLTKEAGTWTIVPESEFLAKAATL
ncbi:MAG: hypothetical protein HDR44_05320 [Allobaculum sp.]|nr:hypothetical protein [Allobaculum sp.]